MNPMTSRSLLRRRVPFFFGGDCVGGFEGVCESGGLEHAEVVDVAHVEGTDHLFALVVFLRSRALDVVHEVGRPARYRLLVEGLRLGSFDVVDVDVVSDELRHHRLQRLEARQLVDRVQRVAVFSLRLELRDGRLRAFDVVVSQVVVGLVQWLVQLPRTARVYVVVLEAEALVLEDPGLVVHDVAREQRTGLAQDAVLIEADVVLAW